LQTELEVEARPYAKIWTQAPQPLNECFGDFEVGESDEMKNGGYGHVIGPLLSVGAVVEEADFHYLGKNIIKTATIHRKQKAILKTDEAIVILDSKGTTVQ
jgi:hypothetical protein